MRSGRIWWGVKRKRRYQCHMKTIWENDNDEQAGIKLDSKLRKRRREKIKEGGRYCQEWLVGEN